MRRQDKVYSTFCKLFTSDGIDANTIANQLNITRANASHDLNLLCQEGKLYKTNTRPVLFFLNSNYCESEKINSLDTLLKNNISLKHSIEQAKAAVVYPPHGMNCLILGETGVGKSMFASLMYDFAISMGIKKSNAPFISFNCADYSNNPELLTSQLFGVVKGAYTGAISDKSGLIEEANEGILFLDEIHRLPPEGQEALFTFLDNNKFRRIGDSKLRESTVLIICATTENPKNALLQTFIRRIPMTITIPPLRERSLEERLYLIKKFFNCESKRISKDIFVSINTMRALLSYNCPNNIGQLKNDIQLLCAKAYSDYLTNQNTNIEITSRELPSYIRKGLYDEKENRVLWNKILNSKMDFFKFSNIKIYDDEILNDNNSCSIYNIIENRIEFLKSKGISDITIDNILEKDISKYFNKYITAVKPR